LSGNTYFNRFSNNKWPQLLNNSESRQNQTWIYLFTLLYFIYFGQGFPLVSQNVGHSNLVIVCDTAQSHDVLPHQVW